MAARLKQQITEQKNRQVEQSRTEDLAVQLKQKISERNQADAAALQREHAAQAIRDIDQKDKYIAQQKVITELTYKAQIVSIGREELGIAAIKSTFVLVPTIGEYVGAVSIAGKTTLTYVAGKAALKIMVENGLDKVLESKGYIRSEDNQPILLRIAEPILPYPLQIIIRHEDLIAARQGQ